MMDADSISVPEQGSHFLHQAMTQGEEEFKHSEPEDSHAALFWEQQKKAHLKGKGDEMASCCYLVCIALHSKFSSSYNLLRQSGFINFPHANTLHAYTHFGDPTSGFN